MGLQEQGQITHDGQRVLDGVVGPGPGPCPAGTLPVGDQR